MNLSMIFAMAGSRKRHSPRLYGGGKGGYTTPARDTVEVLDSWRVFVPVPNRVRRKLGRNGRS